MNKTLIVNASIVNEGRTFGSDVLLSGGMIEKIAPNISHPNATVIDAHGKYLFPGAIDDQVHFREPGLTHKGDIHSESRAAVAGGITSYMEMPNTIPAATTLDLLEQKYQRASDVSLANYSFFLGASNDNIEEIVSIDPHLVCGVKIFMGSSTGSLLVDNDDALSRIFAESPVLIATHCEDEKTVKRNEALFREKYGLKGTVELHPAIRSEEACYLSSSKAVALAKKHKSRLHILHISTAKELGLFTNNLSLSQKKITAEACIHHLWFSDKDYPSKGNLIKWNPAIKTEQDRAAIMEAVLDDRIDIIATDHAPHTLEEKSKPYFDAPSGGPLVQHALVAMMDMVARHEIDVEKVVEKMAHAPAVCFGIEKRGFIREGYFADLVIVDNHHPWKVSANNIMYKCKWSPFEGHTFTSAVTHTFVNGNLVYEKGKIKEGTSGMRLTFNR